MGLEMSYLKAVGDLISFHSIQISKVTDSGAKQRRLAHILTQMEKCQTDPRVVSGEIFFCLQGLSNSYRLDTNNNQ